jgi:hypothetical protein
VDSSPTENIKFTQPDALSVQRQREEFPPDLLSILEGGVASDKRIDTLNVEASPLTGKRAFLFPG